MDGWALLCGILTRSLETTLQLPLATWHCGLSTPTHTETHTHTQDTHTHTHTHTQTRCSPPVLLSPGGSKVVISLLQILIWQQLLPVARLPLGRQSPFKSLLPPRPPINTSPIHPPLPSSTPPFSAPSPECPLSPPSPLQHPPSRTVTLASGWIHTGQQVMHGCFGISCYSGKMDCVFLQCELAWWSLFDMPCAAGCSQCALAWFHSLCTAWSCRAGGYGLIGFFFKEKGCRQGGRVAGGGCGQSLLCSDREGEMMKRWSDMESDVWENFLLFLLSVLPWLVNGGPLCMLEGTSWMLTLTQRS